MFYQPVCWFNHHHPCRQGHSLSHLLLYVAQCLQQCWSLIERMAHHTELWTGDATRSHEGPEPETGTRTAACCLTLRSLFACLWGPSLSFSLHFPLHPSLLSPLPLQSWKPVAVSHPLRIKSKILPITHKPFMTCPLGLISLIISFNHSLLWYSEEN